MSISSFSLGFLNFRLGSKDLIIIDSTVHEFSQNAVTPVKVHDFIILPTSLDMSQYWACSEPKLKIGVWDSSNELPRFSAPKRLSLHFSR